MLLALIIVSVSMLISCSTGVFAEDIDSDLIAGKWFSGSNEDNGTIIDLRENGRYYYEVRSFGHKDASASGRWTVKGQSLHLWNLLEQIEDPEGFEQFSFTLSEDSEGRSQMKLRLTLLRTKTYTRIEEYTTVPLKAESQAAEEKSISDLPDINGVWISPEFTAVISGKAITIIENGNIMNAEISSMSASAISISYDNDALSSFSDIFYILDGDVLTVIPASDPAAVITLKKNQR